MVDFYKELNLDRHSRIDEINEELIKQESVWKKREITNPEKATTVLALIIQAKKTFESDSSRRKYDSELEISMKSPEQLDPDKERKKYLEEWKSKALSYYRSNQNDLAKAAIEKTFTFYDVHLDDASLYALASDIYRRNEDYQIAMDYINKAIVIEQDVSSYYISKGLVYECQAGELYKRREYSESDHIISESRQQYRIADDKAQKSGDSVSRGHALGLLAYSYYYLSPKGEPTGVHFAREASRIGDSWGNANRVIEAEVEKQRQVEEQIKQDELRKKKEEEAHIKDLEEKVKREKLKEREDRILAVFKVSRVSFVLYVILVIGLTIYGLYTYRLNVSIVTVFFLLLTMLRGFMGGLAKNNDIYILFVFPFAFFGVCLGTYIVEYKGVERDSFSQALLNVLGMSNWIVWKFIGASVVVCMILFIISEIIGKHIAKNIGTT